MVKLRPLIIPAIKLYHYLVATVQKLMVSKPRTIVHPSRIKQLAPPAASAVPARASAPITAHQPMTPAEANGWGEAKSFMLQIMLDGIDKNSLIKTSYDFLLEGSPTATDPLFLITAVVESLQQRSPRRI